MAVAQRRPILALCLAGTVLCLLPGQGFVGSPAGRLSNSRVVARVGAEYQERQSPRDADLPFDAAAATGDTVDVSFKKRPFGILRYTPGNGGKGAMVQEVIGKSRYPGDPQGQGFAAGVKGGWVVKTINGQDVQTEDFNTVMDLLDDEVADPRFSKSVALAIEKQGGRKAQPAEAPMAITFATIPGYEWKGEVLGADWEPAHR
ncbi:unnamed protein product [Polarella glacialis]|uniref:PDZ domain-containing protein n=1 Tax=Polarella glacialis TaxID=89957 RepID=A0A813LCZ7_POLGL|nr:unnamed protein product [Polarella glacialis]